jgi:phosphonate transport system permease protein
MKDSWEKTMKILVLGAGGIGAPLIFAMNQYDWNKAGAILLGLILLVWGVDILSSRR